MRANFPVLLPKVLVHEGGWSDHKDDPGGATMKGITIGTLTAERGRPVAVLQRRAQHAQLAPDRARRHREPLENFLRLGIPLARLHSGVPVAPAGRARHRRNLQASEEAIEGEDRAPDAARRSTVPRLHRC